MVGQVGIEPTVFLMSRFYGPLPSPAGRTDPYGGTGWNRTNDTLGFNQVLIPHQGSAKIIPPEGMQLIRVKSIRQAIDEILG